MKKKNLEQYKGELVRVHWCDASCGQKESIKKIEESTPNGQLTYTTTYGRLKDVDDFAIIILEEESDSECDYSVIPRSIILEIDTLEYKEDLNDDVIKGGIK